MDTKPLLSYLPHLHAYAVRIRGKLVGLVAFTNGRLPFKLAVEYV